MAPATAHLEASDFRRGIWRDSTAGPERHASLHSKNISEPRPHMISGFPNLVIASGRRVRTETQARFHAIPDHEPKCANRAVDLTTGKQVVSMAAPVAITRSGTEAAKKSSHSAFTFAVFMAASLPPVAGHRGR